MKKWVYYNEIDPFCCEWIKMLMVNGSIGEGEVDSRSIEDVRPGDLKGFSRVHLFAGIAGWEYAMRLANYSNDRGCTWSCSCPCQPFSAAGKGGGFADERHLWPAAHWLIAQRRPVTIFGEQVASKDGLVWFDTVSTDLENTAYSAGAVDICAAGVGAPHIRQRLYWRADSEDSDRWRSDGAQDRRWRNSETGRLPDVGVSPDANMPSQYGRSSGREQSIREQYYECSDSIATRLQRHSGHERNWGKPGWLSENQTRSVAEAGATRGFWGDADWWHGRDGKYRPIESGIFPLASGILGRMGKLRGYGNSIVPVLAAAFIEATEGW